MFIQKQLLLLGICFIALALAEQGEDPSKSVGATEAADAKINWLPAWENEEPVVYNAAGSDTCAAPNGRGLKYLLQEAKALLPVQKMKQIVLRAVRTDKQVRAFKNLLRSKEYRAKTSSLKHSREYIMFSDYSCKALNLDLKYYAQFLRSVFDILATEGGNLDSAESLESTARPGIRGLLKDIREVIPKQQILSLYERLMKTDTYLVRAVSRLQSYEFRQLFWHLRTHDDYKDLRKMLVNAGVPMDELKALIETALGWKFDDGDKLAMIYF